MILRRCIASVLVLGCCMLLTSGCWNRKELNELAIQLATSIDKEGKQYRVASQVVIPSEVSAKTTSSGMSPVTLFQATAPTMIEAFRKMTESSSRKIYSAHLRVLIIDENLAKEGIAEVLDLFSRNPETRTDFYLMVARHSSAVSILETLTSMERIPAENLFYSLDTSAKNWSPTTTVTIEELIEQLVSEGRNPVLTGVQLIGNKEQGKKISNVQQVKPDATVRFTGLAVFSGDKLAGWLDETKSRGYNYILDNVKSSAGHLNCPSGGLIGLETLRNQTVVKADVVDGEPLISIKITNINTVADTECKINLSDPATITDLEHQAGERLQKIIEHTIAYAQDNFDFDVFGFGQKVYQSHPNQWKKMKSEWATKYWPNLKIEYDVKCQIHKIGTTRDSFINHLKK
ncbi:Ger(x)C family spore germination protein [Paenibacillus sp. CAU 1782]